MRGDVEKEMRGRKMASGMISYEEIESKRVGGGRTKNVGKGYDVNSTQTSAIRHLTAPTSEGAQDH